MAENTATQPSIISTARSWRRGVPGDVTVSIACSMHDGAPIGIAPMPQSWPDPRRPASRHAGSIAMRRAFVLSGLAGLLCLPAFAASADVFINELHYDNAGSDSGERVEVLAPAGTSLSGWTLALYNGSNGARYATVSLSGTVSSQCNGFGTAVANVAGIQNGGPDGIALVNAGGAVVQFLSYEGSFSASDGPAAGHASTPITQSETSDTASGTSLQLAGSGSHYEDFRWQSSAAHSFGACNPGQTPTGGGGDGGADGYYDGIDDSSAAALRASLHALIDDHTKIPYTASTTDSWDVLDFADEDLDDPSAITDIYRNASYQKEGGGNSHYNREHTWPNSLGFPDDGPTNFPYTDLHMLMLSDIAYNAERGNLPYGNCNAWCTEYPTVANDGRGGGSGTFPGNSNWSDGTVWQAWQGVKGNVARAMLYMDVRYEGGTNDVTGTAEPDLRP